MKPRTRTYKPKTGDPSKPKTKTARVAFAPPWEIENVVKAESEANGISKGAAYVNRLALTMSLDPAVIKHMFVIGEKLGVGGPQVLAAASEMYLGFRMGVARVVPPGVVRYPEFQFDKEGLITGLRRISRLTEEFQRREQLLLFACFMLTPEEDRSPEMDEYIRKVKEDVELLREVERVMSEVEPTAKQ